MLLGLYENHVCAVLDALASPDKVFVDVGSADGYFGVGVVASGLFKRSICFEVDPVSRAALAELAALNGVSDRITIEGAADASFASAITRNGVEPQNAVILCDIEGFEFDLFGAEVLDALCGAHVIIELHDRYMADGDARRDKLIEMAKGSFDVFLLDRPGHDPFAMRHLDGFAEDDQWLLCSEGRMIAQQWLVMTPRVQDQR